LLYSNPAHRADIILLNPFHQAFDMENMLATKFSHLFSIRRVKVFKANGATFSSLLFGRRFSSLIQESTGSRQSINVIHLRLSLWIGGFKAD
jgi:hypothetical protein